MAPLDRALAAFARKLTATPWLVDARDRQALHDLGLDDGAVAQAVTVVAQFQHFTRMADAVGIEFDYATPLPPLRIVDREPAPRPPRDRWPRPGPRALDLETLRPASAQALQAYRAQGLEKDGALPRAERLLLARVAADTCCDVAPELPAVELGTPREQALATFARHLSLTPWRTIRPQLDALRAVGLDDEQLLDAAAVTAMQNVWSRLELGLTGFGRSAAS